MIIHEAARKLELQFAEVHRYGSGAPNLFVFHDMMLNARLDREAKAQTPVESTSRVTTPTPGTFITNAQSLFRDPLTTKVTDELPMVHGYDSSNDTEPEERSAGLQTVFSSFNSFQTVDTSPATSQRNLFHLAPSEISPLSTDVSRLRRSISADRLTMRSPKYPIPPPLLRTKSDGLTLWIPQKPVRQDDSTLSSAQPPSSSTQVSPLTRASKIVDANTVLNTFCSHQLYSKHHSPSHASSENESGDDRQRECKGALKSLPSPLHTEILANRDKGNSKIIAGHNSLTSSAINYDDIGPPDFLSSSLKRFTLGPSDDTDDDRRYETVSEGMSDVEDIYIPSSIPTTSSLPPIPPPTVSRSRSSSRSFPSPALNNDIPPVPPLPPFALLDSRARALSSPRLANSFAADQRSLQTPTPTQSLNTPLPPTPSTASISISSSSVSLSSAVPDGSASHSARNISPKPGYSSAPEKLRQRSVSESGGGSGAGSSSGTGSGARGRFTSGLALALRKSPSTSSGRGIEHIKPTPAKPRTRPKYTFAFVGSAGCGKTTLIEKGSKMGNSRYKSQVTLKTVRYGDADMTFEVREAAVIVDKTHSAYPAHAVEFDSAPFIKALESGKQFWPSTMPEVDGVVLCYDASHRGNELGSFGSIAKLSTAFAELHYPIIWVACKSDWVRPPKKDGQLTSPRVLPEGIVSPQDVYLQAASKRIGLIEVTKSSGYGKEQMRNLLTWMYKAIGRARRERQVGEPGQQYHNHASPEVLDRKPAQSSHPKPPPIIVPDRSAPTSKSTTPPQPSSPASPPPKSPVSPTSLLAPMRTTRARSMSDLLSQAARDRVAETSAAILRKASATVNPAVLPRPTQETMDSITDRLKEMERGSQGVDGDVPKTSENDTSVIVVRPKFKPDPFAFATLEQLIMRLLGGNSSEPDSTFNNSFLLTYRRFASPRSVLLCIIRYLRSQDVQDKPRALAILSDCLRTWMRNYPTDFSAPGAIPPLENLIRILNEDYSENVAQELEKNVEPLHELVDEAKDWAKPTTDFTEHSDSDTERDPESRPNSQEIQSASPRPSLAVIVSTTTVIEPAPPATPQSHSAVVRRASSSAPVITTLSETEEQELRRVAKIMLTLDPEHIAEEITRGDLNMFMAIKPRDWMRHAYTLRRDRDPAVHALDQIAHRFERLGLLIASLVLISTKRRHRCTMFELFVRVALVVRGFNNFAALHTIVAALDKVYCGEDGPAIESFVQSRDLNWNKWLSLRVLILKSNGTAYKTALKHTTQPLIPTMAIHTSDLVRVMSNRDYKEDNLNLIHWGKFQIIAKIVGQMSELQDRLRATTNYDFVARPGIASLLNDPKTMSEEMIIERTFPNTSEGTSVRTGTWSTRVLRKVLR